MNASWPSRPRSLPPKRRRPVRRRKRTTWRWSTLRTALHTLGTRRP